MHRASYRFMPPCGITETLSDVESVRVVHNMIYSYMKYTNIGSYSTAMANGMKKVKEYPDPKNEISYAYAISRTEWEKEKGQERSQDDKE